MLTDAEVADLQKFAAQIVENDGDAQFGDGLILAVLNRITNPTLVRPGHRQLQPVLAGRARLARSPDIAHHRSAGRQASADDARGADSGGRPRSQHRKAHAFEDPEVFPLGERCVNFGIPRLQAGYNSYLQIVQSPDYVVIMNEMAHDARIIPLDGRPHLDPRIRVWNGDSRGHWEGDTLVIETTNFSPKSDFMGSHENLRLIERFTRAGARHPELRVHGQRSDDVDGAVDGDDSAQAERRIDLRVRVPRGERRDPQHAARASLRGARGGGEEPIEVAVSSADRSGA